MMTAETGNRVTDLEAELLQRDEKIKRLTVDLDEAHELVGKMREHVDECNQALDGWIDVFDMQQDEAGTWLFDPQQSKLWEAHHELLTRHRDLLRQWNKFVGKYNAVISPREKGRPIAASAEQQATVLTRRKAGDSLRKIAAATGLSFATVRTITEKAAGKGRTSKRTNEVRRREFDRLRAAAYRARKKQRDSLPKEIDELQKSGATLVKAAKGLGAPR